MFDMQIMWIVQSEEIESIPFLRCFNPEGPHYIEECSIYNLKLSENKNNSDLQIISNTFQRNYIVNLVQNTHQYIYTSIYQ